MRGLNWFQARDLNLFTGRAIRREGWQRWIFYRDHGYYCQEGTALRVVENHDLTSQDAQAKDWTDEVYEGGTTPPCCTAGPAATALAPNSTGGLAGWALPGEPCGGSGQGGNVPAVAYDSSSSEENPGEEPDTYTLQMRYELASNMGVELFPDGPGGKWHHPPTSGVCLGVRMLVNGVPLKNTYDHMLYIAPPGTFIDSMPPGGKFWHYNGTTLVYEAAPGFLRAGCVSLQPNDDGWFYFGAAHRRPGEPFKWSEFNRDYTWARQNGQDALVTITPGQTWRAKAFFCGAGPTPEQNAHLPTYEGTMVVPGWYEPPVGS